MARWAIHRSATLSKVFGASLALAFVPGWVDGATAPRWILASLWIAATARTVNWPMAVLAAWAAVTLLWTIDLPYGMFHLWMLILMAAFAVQERNLEQIALGAGLGLALQLPLALLQLAGIDPVLDAIPPAGLFFVKTYFAEAAALAAVLNRRRIALCIALCLIVAVSGNRESQAALVAVAIWLLCGERFVRFAICCTLIAALAVAFGHLDPIHSRDLGFRLDFWRDTISHTALWGHGLGSFWALWPSWASNFAAGRPEYPHNEFVWLLSELGLPGILFGLGFGVFCWRARGLRAALICLAVETCFGFPFQLPVTLVLASLVLGRAYSDAVRSMDRSRDYLYLWLGRAQWRRHAS